MKLNILLAAACVTLLPGGAHAEARAQDLLNAEDKMTPEEAQLFRQKLESKNWQPLPEGFFTRMSVSIAGDLFQQRIKFHAP